MLQNYYSVVGEGSSGDNDNPSEASFAIDINDPNVAATTFDSSQTAEKVEPSECSL